MNHSYWIVFSVSALLLAFIAGLAFRKKQPLIGWAFVVALVGRMLFVASVVLERFGYWLGGMQTTSRFVELISVGGYVLMALYVVRIKEKT